MVPLDFAALIVPGVPGVADNVARHADDVQIARIWATTEGTETGADAIRRANMGREGLPSVEFKRMDIAGYYDPDKHIIFLAEDYRNLPPELAAPTLAHELDHRARRWRSASVVGESRARRVQAQTWEELRGRVTWDNFTDRQMKLITAHDETLDAVRNGQIARYIRNRYPKLPVWSGDVSPIWKEVFKVRGREWSW